MRAIRCPLVRSLQRLAALGIILTGGALAPTGWHNVAARVEDKAAPASSEPVGAAKGQDIDGDSLPAGSSPGSESSGSIRRLLAR